MNIRRVTFIGIFFIISSYTIAQHQPVKAFTRADSLRGSITPDRSWWDLLHYTINLQPNITNKTIEGNVAVKFRAIKDGKRLQIDLQQPLIIDSITQLDPYIKTKRISFIRAGDVAYIQFPKSINKGTTGTIKIFYHGKPREAIRPPWDGGISWQKDVTGAPFISTSCQGLGASAWWPCKDHQADEPDSGIIISVKVPDTLLEVSNGRLIKTILNKDHTKTFVWEVKNPINNYGVSLNIGNYELIKDTFNGEGGLLNLSYYILKTHKDIAVQQLKQVKVMLKCFEYWMGKYPFYEDGYKLVEVPYLGMEHQSNVAYGNKFKNGYLGRDLSGTGWGLNWDFIIIHESGHEWFGNNITSKDIADMWIHEGFTNYTETLFTQWLDGKAAANQYNLGSRKNILNDLPIIGPYGVNKTGSGDMYYKASAMIHSIRNAMDNDELFRRMLRELNKRFYHSTVTTKDIEKVINQFTGFSVDKIFNQYLRETKIPVFEYYLSSDRSKMYYRYTNSVNGFNMPLVIPIADSTIKIIPKNEEWQTLNLTNGMANKIKIKEIDKLFYLTVYEKKELTIKAF